MDLCELLATTGCIEGAVAGKHTLTDPPWALSGLAQPTSSASIGACSEGLVLAGDEYRGAAGWLKRGSGVGGEME
jgi:hypothetical protein